MSNTVPHQQNKCYPKGVRLSEKLLLQHSVMKFDRSNKFYVIMGK